MSDGKPGPYPGTAFETWAPPLCRRGFNPSVQRVQILRRNTPVQAALTGLIMTACGSKSVRAPIDTPRNHAPQHR